MAEHSGSCRAIWGHVESANVEARAPDICEGGLGRQLGQTVEERSGSDGRRQGARRKGSRALLSAVLACPVCLSGSGASRKRRPSRKGGSQSNA